jgi:hypothetical protein
VVLTVAFHTNNSPTDTRRLSTTFAFKLYYFTAFWIWTPTQLWIAKNLLIA